MRPGDPSSTRCRPLKRFLLNFAAVVLALMPVAVIAAPQSQKSEAMQHSDPLNFDPMVRDGYEHIYNLDYDGALERFETVLKEHPKEPMAYGYVQMAMVFRELYHQDLLDTTWPRSR